MSFVLAMLAVVSGGDHLSYEDALAQAQRDGKPLLVLVSARWCAPCQIMKRDTIQSMKESGELRGVVFTVVDRDNRPRLAKQIMKPGGIPQLAVYARRDGRWRRFGVVGFAKTDTVRDVIRRATEYQR